jgi:3-keto-L-gulonate-6-phosphate decarboxylase
MDRQQASGVSQWRDLVGERSLVQIDRRSFLRGATSLAAGGLTAGAMVALVRPEYAWAGQAAQAHAPSARLVDRLKTQFTFQISVDVSSLDQGLGVATAAMAAGITILEMGTPLLKTQGVANVVPAFRKRFPEALLLADMKTMDGGGGEARAVYAGGANIIDFLALAGVATAKNVCATRDEFRRTNPDMPRLAFADLLLPNHATTTEVIDAARRMVDAGVDGVGVHLQSDARRADPSLIERDVLGRPARAVFDAVGDAVSVQVVGGLSIAQAKSLAQAGLRAFVISGNLGQPDSRGRYDLPPAEFERHVAAFIAEVSGV